MRRAAEHGLGERREADLLAEKFGLLLEQGLLREVAGEPVEAGEVAGVEGEEQLAQPGVFGVFERVEDGVQEELAKVVDGLAEQGGDGEVVGAFLLLGGAEVGDVDAGEVEEGVFVVGGEFEFCLRVGLLALYVVGCGGGSYVVVIGVHAVE